MTRKLEDDTDKSSATSTVGQARRAYRAPRLRHLGSVRELTLGGSKGQFEGAGTRKNVTGKG